MRRNMRRSVVLSILGIGIVVSSCAMDEREWMKIDQKYTTADFRRDLAECTIKGKLDEDCMKARGWVASYAHPFVGKLDQVGLVCDLSETPGRVQGPPLVVGQHSREILAELGYAAEEIDTLCRECVLDWAPGQAHRVVIPSKWLPKEIA